MSKALALHNVSITLGLFELRDISLALESGDYLVVMGPSGCGKTTLLRIICGLLSPQNGEIEIAGANTRILPTSKRRASYVPQGAALFPHLSVLQNIQFGQKYVKANDADKKHRFGHIVRLLGLESLLNRYPQGLSGGEGKRVALARALVTEPLLLLLDEPLGMLDKPARDEMTQVLGNLHRELGTTSIHVTHDREEARALGTICCVMENGRVVQTGSYTDITAGPANKFVADFIGLQNVFSCEVMQDNGSLSLMTPLGNFPADNVTSSNSTCLVHFPPHKFSISEDLRTAKMGTILEINPRGHVMECLLLVHNSTLVHVQLKSSCAGHLMRGDSLPLFIAPPILLGRDERPSV